MYEYYNANVLGKYEEDCTIRSISCATNKSWDYVYDLLSDLAQFEGTMMDNREFIIDYLDSKYERVYVGNETVGEVAERFSDNVVLISMNGHICCSRFGIVLDTFDPTDRQAEYCWIVE